MTKIPVLASVRAAIRFAQANIARVAGVLGLVMLLNIAGEMAVSRVAQVLTFVAAVLAGLMANAGLLRLAFADEHGEDAEFRIGPQGFQFGIPEVRLLGAMLLLALFGFIALLFMLLLAALFTVGIVFSHGQTTVAPDTVARSPEVEAMVTWLVRAFVVIGVCVWIRLFTYPASTISNQRIQVFSTWRVTHGNWLRMLLSVTLILTPLLISDGLLAAALQHLFGQPDPLFIFSLAVFSAAIHAFVEIPLLCGLSAVLYKDLRGTAPQTAMLPVEDIRPGLAGPWG